MSITLKKLDWGGARDPANTMDVDNDPATNPQTLSEKYGRMTLRRERKIRAANVPLPQTHILQKLIYYS